MGNGDPEVPKLPSVQGISWAALSLGNINSETWSSRLGKKLNAKKPEAMPARHRSRWQGIVEAVKA
jgi:hypothetical protein